jgi:ribosomal-protein-serine acetyltransferase
MEHPPDCIELAPAGIVLRRHRTDDVDVLHAVIEASRDHLRPWMPWADQDRAGTAGFVERAQQEWTSGESYSYLIVEQPAGGPDRPPMVLGGCGLHRRSTPETIEIGYWLRPEAVGRGVMTAAAGKLTEVAFSLDGIERVEIRCDEANVRSASIPHRLGFTLARTDDRRPVQAPGECGCAMVWVRDRPRDATAVPGV